MYWSNSKFADFVRGTVKPQSETYEGWEQWNAQAKKAHPVRYWITEDVFDFIQNIIFWPHNKINSIGFWFKNRFIIKSHCLTAHPTDIPPGQWCDLSERLLYCSFNELVNFVEIECANLERPGRGRSARLGKKYLKYCISLVYNEEWGCAPDDPLYGQPMPQAKTYSEILNLYLWWTETRPKRKDPHDESDQSLWPWDTTLSDEEREKLRASIEKTSNIEQQYRDEDDEMLISLIRTRHHLWT